MGCQQCGKETATFFVYSPLMVCGECYTKLIMGTLKPKPVDVSAQKQEVKKVEN